MLQGVLKGFGLEPSRPCFTRLARDGRDQLFNLEVPETRAFEQVGLY